MSNVNGFGHWLRVQRVKAGYHQDELGDVVDRAKCTVSAWENGRAYPPATVCGKLADLFDAPEGAVMVAAGHSDGLGEFGAWLRSAMSQYDYTFRRLGRVIGVSEGCITGWLEDRRTPSIDRSRMAVCFLADALNAPRSAVLDTAGLEDVQADTVCAPPALYEALADWLAACRQRLNVTQEEMAGRVAVSISTYRNWEQRGTRPRRERCEQIAEALNVPLSDVNRLAGYGVGGGLPAAWECPGTCSACERLEWCREDERDGLPIHCEAVDRMQLIQARNNGHLERLMARYEEV
jgi:transcriptional regulator with XRE-family HTH domain